MTRTAPLLALALTFGLGISGSAFADGTTTGRGKVSGPAAADGSGKKEDTAKEKVAAYETALKDMKRVDGDMTLYRRGKEVLLELPEDKLGKLFFIQAALSTGIDDAFMSAGMPIGDTPVDVFKFERNDGTVSLVRPNIANRWDAKDPLAIGAARTFPEATLSTFRIEQENPEKKLLLVNLTTLFYGDIFRLGEMVMSELGGPYQVERDKSGVTDVKGYPDNTVVRMKLMFSSPRGGQANPLAALFGIGQNTLEDDRSAPLAVTYNLSYRKDDGFKPRAADPRIGYFTQDFFSVDRFLATDRTEKYILRWQLVKRDPKAAVSEPVKPIVFTIDPSIPPAYRPAVKDGVLRWNKAFEGLGFKNAIQVQDVPASDKDYDHADARYNVIRMLVGPGAPFAAISLPRTDPLTGQILNASIDIDSNVIRDLQVEHQRNLASLNTSSQRAMDVLRRDPQRTITDDDYLFATPQEEAVREMEARMEKFGWSEHACDYAGELSQEAAIDYYALMASSTTPVNKEDYVRQFLSDCVSHEVGHCLGLRHNFAGSTNLTTAQLADDSLTSKVGVSASVMDYTPPNVQAILKGKGNFYMPTIGVYDEWAIKYGYADFGHAPLGERFYLAQIASESGLPGHAYMTDEDADTFDPYAVRFDLGKDPLNFSEKVLLALGRARDYAIHNMPKPGESYARRTDVILSSIVRSFREGRLAARFVGGIAASKNFKGDQGEQPTLSPVTPSVQRQAVSLVVRHFFAPDAFAMPPAVLDTLSMDGSRPGWTAPLRDIIGTYQDTMLALLIGASTTDRMAENAYKKGGYNIDEHYGAIMGAVFDEVGRSVDISPLRRDLQRFAVNGLMTQASAPQGSISEDVRMITTDVLRRLEKRIADQSAHSSKLDTMTRIHLRDTHDAIARFLSRSVVTSR